MRSRSLIVDAVVIADAVRIHCTDVVAEIHRPDKALVTLTVLNPPREPIDLRVLLGLFVWQMGRHACLSSTGVDEFARVQGDGLLLDRDWYEVARDYAIEDDSWK